jgi:hypothetical protein
MLSPIRPTHPLVILLFGLIATAAAPAPAPAADPAAGKAVAKKLLDAGWDKSAAARTTVVQQYDAAVKVAPGDPFLLHAYWLVLMYQGRYEESLESLNDFIKRFSTYPQGFRAKAWVHTVLKEYPQAMAAAESLAPLAARNPTESDKDALATQDEMLTFLGQLAGFLEGPAEKPAIQDRRKKFEAQVLARLDEVGKKKFEASKVEVLSEFKRLISAAEGADQEGKKAAADEKQKKLEDLEKERNKIGKAADKVEDQGKKVADELKQTLADLDRKAATLAQNLTKLQAQAAMASRQVTNYRDQARSLEKAANPKGNPNSQGPSPDAQRATTTANQYQAQLDGLNVLIVQTQASLLANQQQRQQALGGANVQGLQLQNEKLGLNELQRKNENKQKRTEKPKESTSGRAVALESQARAFKTYSPFPFDELKGSLLEKIQ